MKTKILGVLSGMSVVLSLLSSCNQKADKYTRGVGIYPGNPAEDFAPTLLPDQDNYRNIARLRPAYHSSSYDYNLTAQLVTDGIISREMPVYISISTHQGVVPKNEREWLLDHNRVTEMSLEGTDIWIMYAMNKEAIPFEIEKITLDGTLTYDEKKSGGWQFVCSGSNDGVLWDELGKFKGSGLPGREWPNPFAAFRPPPKPKGKDVGKQPPDFFSFFRGSLRFRFRCPKTVFYF